MALNSWVLLLKTAENTGVLFPQDILLSPSKKKAPHHYKNLKGTLNRHEHLTMVHVQYSVFMLTSPLLKQDKIKKAHILKRK